MFNVLNLSSGEFVKNLDGSVRVFTTGEHASAVAASYTATSGDKHRVRRMIAAQEAATESWQARERARFDSGFYVRPDWIAALGVAVKEEHFVHVSHKNSAMIAYTKDAVMGAADRQSVIKVETYVREICGEGEHFSKRVAAIHASTYAPSPVKFAVTEDEITHVYVNGPDSCMGGKAPNHSAHDRKTAAYFCLLIHPAAVYAGGGLQLAYLEHDGVITARALVWPEHMVYSRLYGDYDGLAKGLQALGYKSGSLEGARLRLVRNRDYRIILPYLDGCNRVSIVDSNWLVLSDDGDILGDCTDGLARAGFCCEGCDDEGESDDSRTVYVSRRETQNWCESCCDSRAFYCPQFNEYVSNDCGVNCDGDFVADWWAENNANFCEWSEEWTMNPTRTIHRDLFNGQWMTEEWGQTAYLDRAFKCRVSGDWFHNQFRVNDSWSDLPRCVHVAPDDVPDDFDGVVEYRCLETLNLNLEGVAA
jgi:hypothetical protein